MFSKLRRQMTGFCTLITGAIFVGMTVLCLFLSERSIRENQYQTFLNDVNAIVSYLESQTVISNQWLAKMEGSKRLSLSLYDNALPLLYNSLKEKQEGLADMAREISAQEHGLDIFASMGSAVLPQTVTFSIQDQSGQSFYAAAAVFPKANGTLSAIAIYPLVNQQRQILTQRLLFAGVDLVGLGALAAFAWIFTGKMLRPLEESRRKQAQFVAAASHELRSPLAVILSNLSALEKAGPEEQERFRENIRAEGTRMSRLVDDMLALASADSRSWAVNRSPVELDTLALEVYEQFSSMARERGLRFSVSLPEEEIPLCRCDGNRIAQALSVLLDNAFSYTPSGGRVELSLTLRPGGRVRFSVADTGPGVSEEEKERIFQRFYRADASRQNREHFGLGLCVAREIVELHKGRLWVEDAPGGGAVFCMEI